MNDTSMQKIKVGHRTKIQSKFMRTGNKACKKKNIFFISKFFSVTFLIFCMQVSFMMAL